MWSQFLRIWQYIRTRFNVQAAGRLLDASYVRGGTLARSTLTITSLENDYITNWGFKPFE